MGEGQQKWNNVALFIRECCLLLPQFSVPYRILWQFPSGTAFLQFQFMFSKVLWHWIKSLFSSHPFILPTIVYPALQCSKVSIPCFASFPDLWWLSLCFQCHAQGPVPSGLNLGVSFHSNYCIVLLWFNRAIDNCYFALNSNLFSIFFSSFLLLLAFSASSSCLLSSGAILCLNKYSW